VGLQPGSQDLFDAMETQLDDNLERLVEQGLRRLSGYVWLGQSGLATDILVEGANYIDRGKAVRAAHGRDWEPAANGPIRDRPARRTTGVALLRELVQGLRRRCSEP